MLEKYIKNNVSKDYTSIGLFKAIKEKFNNGKVLYPGSYVHITPSLIFSDVVYIDSFKNTYKFYDSSDVKDYVEKNKQYKEKTTYTFHQQNYSNDLPEKIGSFDIIISNIVDLQGEIQKDI